MTSMTRNFDEAVALAELRQIRIRRCIAFLTIAIPTLATVTAIGLIVTDIARPSVFELLTAALLYVLTVFGITVGYHRLLAHRAFAAPAGVRIALTILGAMAAQGPPLFWVSEHREHHHHSDRRMDPHSPYLLGTESPAGMRGFWHAHIGWMMSHSANGWTLHAPDLLRDHAVRFVDRWYFLWLALGIALPGFLAGLWHHSVAAMALGSLWGGMVRICLVHQATWSVNSLCHLFGKRPFATADQSRNNRLVALLSLGEGWHNNHHAFPYSARQGLMRWELDPSYAVIRLLASVGLASQIKTPSANRIAEAKRPVGH